ncbi:MAG TPA: HAD-IIA family hydrolase [Aggregatilineales bacterium]|nr:HAD-IIA family hydrolase [Aggregatilineales bacterium]
MALDFSRIRGVISDMDGVVWRTTTVLPGTPDFFLFLRERGIPYALATNNSSRSVEEYQAQLAGVGIPVAPEYIITSGVVTLDEMERTYPPGTPVYVLGADSLVEKVAARGYVIDPARARVVIVGLDRHLTYQKLATATTCILNGADFIGTNGDLTFPAAEGLAPGNGAILAALQAATGRAPRLMGKPEQAMFRSALTRLGTDAAHTLMIGDRLDTDIAGAKRGGLQAALVLTGVSEDEESPSIGSDGPDATYSDLAALLKDFLVHSESVQH